MKLAVTHKMNGVDTARLRETVGAVKTSPELARFRFRIENRWIDGGENQSEVKSFHGCGQMLRHKMEMSLTADEPDILLGGDNAANPVEHLLHALASCLTTSMVYHAAARGINIQQIESALEGDLDLRGFLGLDPMVRNGYQQIRLTLRIKAEMTDEQMQELSSLGPMFSPVYDSLTRGVPVFVCAERLS
jgi:uncharacterized OsmC-like protein